MRIAFNTLFSSDDTISSIKTFFNSLDLDVDLHSDDSEGLKIIPMHHLALEHENGEAVFALIKLKERRNFLLIRQDQVDTQDRIGLMPNAVLTVKEQFVQRKLKSLRKDVEFEVRPESEILSMISLGEAKSVVVSGCFVSDQASTKYKIVPLDSREFGHQAGQGYLAVIGPKEDPLRKLIRKQNTRDDIAICNIERKMLSMSNLPLNNHCEIDEAANFHLWAFSENAETHISQSTRNEIEERALKNL